MVNVRGHRKKINHTSKYKTKTFLKAILRKAESRVKKSGAALTSELVFRAAVFILTAHGVPLGEAQHLIKLAMGEATF